MRGMLLTVVLQPSDGGGGGGGGGDGSIDVDPDHVVLTSHAPVMLEAVKKSLRNHFMARYVSGQVAGGIMLADAKNCVVCHKVRQHECLHAASSVLAA